VERPSNLQILGGEQDQIWRTLILHSVSNCRQIQSNVWDSETPIVQVVRKTFVSKITHNPQHVLRLTLFYSFHCHVQHNSWNKTFQAYYPALSYCRGTSPSWSRDMMASFKSSLEDKDILAAMSRLIHRTTNNIYSGLPPCNLFSPFLSAPLVEGSGWILSQLWFCQLNMYVY